MSQTDEIKILVVCTEKQTQSSENSVSKTMTKINQRVNEFNINESAKIHISRKKKQNPKMFNQDVQVMQFEQKRNCTTRMTAKSAHSHFKLAMKMIMRKEKET